MEVLRFWKGPFIAWGSQISIHLTEHVGPELGGEKTSRTYGCLGPQVFLFALYPATHVFWTPEVFLWVLYPSFWVSFCGAAASGRRLVRGASLVFRGLPCRTASVLRRSPAPGVIRVLLRNFQGSASPFCFYGVGHEEKKGGAQTWRGTNRPPVPERCLVVFGSV